MKTTIPSHAITRCDLHEMRKALLRSSCLVGTRAGIIRRVNINPRGYDDPSLFLAYAEPSAIDTFSDVVAANRGAACDLTAEAATIRAIGECVERYCGATYNRDMFRSCSFENLSGEGLRAVDPERLCLFSADQYREKNFPFARLTRQSIISWARGYCLTGKSDAYLPASFVYVPYRFDMTVERPSHMPISTGLAAAQSLRQAVTKGILEIIERDAFMIAWRFRLKLPQVRLDSISDPEVRHLVAAGSTTGGTWKILVLPSNVPVPVVMTLLVNENGIPKTSFGACAAANWNDAVVGAMKESFLTRYYVNYMLRNPPPVARMHVPGDYAWVRTLEDHAIVHAVDSELRARVLSMCGDPIDLPQTNPSESVTLKSLTNHLARLGFDVFFADLTTADVDTAGISVARVIIPGMQPLDNDHRYRHEGGRRLHDAASRLGVLASPSDLCDLPHPFP